MRPISHSLPQIGDLLVTGNPHILDITRSDIWRMGFAHGIHFCPGAPLARLKGQITFRTLLDNCTDFALAVDREQIKRKLTCP
jgi:cytochrome P450